MRIIRSEVMGFCAGVRSAVRLLEGAIERGRTEGRPVYTIGPLIHNERFMEAVQRQGVRVIGSTEDAPAGIAVIRAHGISRRDQDRFVEHGFSVIDGTCPRVLKSERLVEEYAQNGYQIILVGDKGHGEVQAVAGHHPDPDAVQVIDSIEEIDQIRLSGKVLLLSQTTFSQTLYDGIADALIKRSETLSIDVTVMQSICPSTANRQDALRSMCERADEIIVVGGRSSANTRRLYEIACSCCPKAYHISDPSEVTMEMLSSEVIGITAGASTPDWLVTAVEKRLSSLAGNISI